MDLLTITRQFATHERCRELLRRLRWPDGAICPRCAHTGTCWLTQQEKFECNKCAYQFSVTAGTIFHDSHLPLEKWFLAVHIMVESKKGISALQMKRMLGIGGYKTAWYLCHRIRAAMKEVNPEPLKGTVEYDETWHGGSRKGMGKGYVGNKTMIMGAIERGGPIRLKVEKRVNKKAVTHFLQKNVSPETERIYTDAHPNYAGVDFGNAEHQSVDHKAEEWVRGDVHTNSIEGVWSLFKRSVVGSYHQLSEKHLQAYLDEFAWRFDRRKSERLFLDTLNALIHAPTLTFKKLTEEASESEVVLA
jgi:transposase-like protein